MVISGKYIDKIDYCHVKDYQTTKFTSTNQGNDYKWSVQNLNYLIQSLIEVLNVKFLITANALEGMKVFDIIERIYAFRHL
jgi:hypothetical protein